MRLIVSLAARLPYRQVSEVLEEAGYSSVSHTSVHNEVKYFGQKEAEELEGEARALFNHAREPEGKKKEVSIFLNP